MRALLPSIVLSGALLLGHAAGASAQVTSRGTRLPPDDERWRGRRAPIVIGGRDLPRECRDWGWGDRRGRDDDRWDDDDRGKRRRGHHSGRRSGWNDRDDERWRRDYQRARRRHAELHRRAEREHAKWHRKHDRRRRDASLRRRHQALHRRLARQHESWHRRDDPCGRVYGNDRRRDRRVSSPWPGYGWPHRDLWSTLAELIAPDHW